MAEAERTSPRRRTRRSATPSVPLLALAVVLALIGVACGADGTEADRASDDADESPATAISATSGDDEPEEPDEVETTDDPADGAGSGDGALIGADAAQLILPEGVVIDHASAVLESALGELPYEPDFEVRRSAPITTDLHTPCGPAAAGDHVTAIDVIGVQPEIRSFVVGFNQVVTVFPDAAAAAASIEDACADGEDIRGLPEGVDGARSFRIELDEGQGPAPALTVRVANAVTTVVAADADALLDAVARVLILRLGGVDEADVEPWPDPFLAYRPRVDAGADAVHRYTPERGFEPVPEIALEANEAGRPRQVTIDGTVHQIEAFLHADPSGDAVAFAATPLPDGPSTLFRWALGEPAPVPLDSADVIYDPDWGEPRREVHRRVAWSADGRVIVANRPIVDDDEEVVVFAADGSDRRTITVDYRLGSVPFRSPGSLRSIVGDRLFTTDGTTALDAPAATGGRLWVAPLSGGAAERVHPGDEAPRLSALASTPDGTTLVFVNRGRDLTVRDVDTGAERVVIDRTLGDVCLAPGADGRVAIGSRQGGTLSVLDLETGEVEAEVALPGQPSAPQWGSDGRILVPISYDVPVDGVESRVLIVDPGSGRATALPGSDGFALLPVTDFC